MRQASGPAASEPSIVRGAALAFVVALVATLLLAAPVVMAPSERLFGSGATLGPEDPNRDALVVIEQFRAGRVPAPYLQPLTDLPGRALARLVGGVAAYNILVLVTFPLSAAAAYLLARSFVASHFGALVAALAYAFLPFHVAQASGHPHAAQTQWLPLYLLALWRCIDRPSLARGALLCVSAAAVALADFYGGLIAAVLSPVALVAYGVVSPNSPSAGRLRRVAIVVVILAGAAGAGLMLIHHFAPAILLTPGSLAFERGDLFAWSARWWSYLIPPAEHPIWGTTVREFWARRDVGASLVEHQQVSLSWSLLVLATVPLWLWLRGNRATLIVRTAPVLVCVAAAAVLCSLSPERTLGSFTFVRPSALLYAWAPMFRAYARFGVVVGLMTAILAGAGATWLWDRPERAARRAAALLLGMALLEYAPAPPWRSRDVLPTRAHRWLAAQSGTLRVLDCVSSSRWSDVLAAPFVGHAITLLGAPSFDDCGEPHLADKLAALGYTHVVVRRNSTIGRALAKSAVPEGLAQEPRMEFEDAVILTVKAESPPVYVGTLVGFHPREYERDASWRWMGRTGAMRFVAMRESPSSVLSLELKAFPRARQVEWFLDGRLQGELNVAPEWHRYELPLGALARGEALLTFACRDPAAVADDVLRNGDLRELGLAVGRWTIGEADGKRSPPLGSQYVVDSYPLDLYAAIQRQGQETSRAAFR
jgi:hypothetical protein